MLFYDNPIYIGYNFLFFLLTTIDYEWKRWIEEKKISVEKEKEKKKQHTNFKFPKLSLLIHFIYEILAFEIISKKQVRIYKAWRLKHKTIRE